MGPGLPPVLGLRDEELGPCRELKSLTVEVKEHLEKGLFEVPDDEIPFSMPPKDDPEEDYDIIMKIGLEVGCIVNPPKNDPQFCEPRLTA